MRAERIDIADSAAPYNIYAPPISLRIGRARRNHALGSAAHSLGAGSQPCLMEQFGMCMAKKTIARSRQYAGGR